MLLADRVLRRALSLRLLETKKDVLLRLLVTDKFPGARLKPPRRYALSYMLYDVFNTTKTAEGFAPSAVFSYIINLLLLLKCPLYLSLPTVRLSLCDRSDHTLLFACKLGGVNLTF